MRRANAHFFKKLFVDIVIDDDGKVLFAEFYPPSKDGGERIFGDGAVNPLQACH
jgi:hypothetical protein